MKRLKHAVPEFEWIEDLLDDDSLPELSSLDVLAHLRGPRSTQYEVLLRNAMLELNRISDMVNTRGAIEQLMYYVFKKGYQAGLDDREPS